jgi:hypothetical protein
VRSRARFAKPFDLDELAAVLHRRLGLGPRTDADDDPQ